MRKQIFKILFLLVTFLMLPNFASAEVVSGMDIPASHPRLWWNSQRLLQAQNWYQANPFTPANDDYVGQAFRSLMTGEANYCQSALDWALNYTISDSELNSTASDHARWDGERVILIYDWCYGYMTEQDRSNMISRWDNYLNILRQKSWGRATMYQSNYNWGYTRNMLEWGIATYGEGPMATTFIDEVLSARLQDNFFSHASTTGKGGVLQEGGQYGPYLTSYSVVPFITSNLLGRSLYDETNFFKEAIFYIIYATTPSQTYNRNSGNLKWEVFPFNDDETFVNGGTPKSIYYGNYMSTVANLWSDVSLGKYARKWLTVVTPSITNYVQAVDNGGMENDFINLPLDYYAPGPGYFYGRNEWGASSTVFNLQLGQLTGAGHEHNDIGSWQIWRKGRWMSRETTGYADNIVGYNSATVTTSKDAAHNAILVNGIGLAGLGYRSGQPIIKRVESRDEYVYANVDLTPVYRATNRPQVDNPAANHVEREYIFVRPLETMVILDRITANDVGATAAADIKKTFLAHFEQNPTIDDSNNVTATNGDQALHLTTLIPSNPTYRIVDEGGEIGQYRLEIETEGLAQSYFLNILQARDSVDANMSSSVEDDGLKFRITLQHSTKGTVIIELSKGESSSSGSIRVENLYYDLLTRVQNISVQDDGPVWEILPAGVDVDTTAPAAPSGLAVN